MVRLGERENKRERGDRVFGDLKRGGMSFRVLFGLFGPVCLFTGLGCLVSDGIVLLFSFIWAFRRGTLSLYWIAYFFEKQNAE